MDFLQYIGHYHPVVLHLPIGFLLLAFVMQLLDWWKKEVKYESAIRLALLLGMIGAILTAITGYWLSLNGGYDADLLQKHQYLGIGVAGLSIVLFLLHRYHHQLYAPTLILLTLLLIGTGHYGGSLTHGIDFLDYKKRNTSAALVNMDEAILFPDIIQPILKEKCIRCHNTSKKKGELLLSTIEGIQKGGESGALFDRKNAAKSLFLQRIHLPLEEEKHMPPKGKKQLTSDEINLLEWWIEEEAEFDKQVATYQPTPAIQAILAKYNTPKDGLDNKAVEKVSDEMIYDLRNAGLPINRVHQNSSFVEVNLSRNQQAKSLLKQLKKVKQQLVSLNVSYSNVSNDDLKMLSEFPHLQKLYLQKTAITNQALSHIQELEYLEYLNLYGTSVDDEGLAMLKELPRLKKLYLWKSATTSEGIARLVSNKPRLAINTGVDKSIFGDAQLKPPLIASTKDLFQDSLEVSLEMNFKNVNLYYTTDGSEPDSTSTQYTTPFSIGNTRKIKAIAHKKGWQTSAVAERQFVQAKYSPVSIALNKAPNDRYKANGGPSLIDFEKGSTTFTDGNWLGYEKSHFTATLDLGKQQSINGITVSALEATGSYIFFPKGMEVSVSMDNKNFQSVLSKTYPTTQEPFAPELKNFTEFFSSPQNTRYVRVKVKSNLVNPDWHPAPGAPCWVFVDEILVQ